MANSNVEYNGEIVDGGYDFLKKMWKSKVG